FPSTPQKTSKKSLEPAHEHRYTIHTYTHYLLFKQPISHAGRSQLLASSLPISHSQNPQHFPKPPASTRVKELYHGRCRRPLSALPQTPASETGTGQKR